MTSAKLEQTIAAAVAAALAGQAVAQAEPARKRRAAPKRKLALPGLKPGEERNLGDGLYLRNQGGAPTFYAHYRWEGEGTTIRRRYRIGRADALSEEEARAEAICVCKMARRGADPLEARQGLHIPTFGEHAEAFMARHLPTLKSKNSYARWRATVVAYSQPIWNLKVNKIEPKDVLACLESIWARIGPTGVEVQRRIAVILDDAAARGLRSGANPAEMTTALKHALGKPGPSRGSMASVPFAELPALVAELREKDHQTAQALLIAIFTAVRTQELLGMRKAELDFEAGTWTIPYARLKVSPHKEDFVVPLSAQAVAVLKAQIAFLEEFGGEVDFVWPGQLGGLRDRSERKPTLSNMTMLNYLKGAMGRAATVHGFPRELQDLGGRSIR
jgi:integrase